jgi:hypothetical protein
MAERTVAEWLALAPSAEESAERDVAPYRDLTPQERWEVFESLLRDMDVLLAGRMPVEIDDDPPFWRRWGDPPLGRPR